MKSLLPFILMLVAMPVQASGYAGLARIGMHASTLPADNTGQPVAGMVDAEDANFLALHSAYLAGDNARLAVLASSINVPLLEPYATYYRLASSLGAASDDEIRQFLARPDDTPLIDDLRGQWLKLLASKGRWDEFQQQFPHLVNSDDELTCYALQARYQSDPHGALEYSRRLWFDGKDMPDNCQPLFDEAIAASIITEQDIWQRMLFALEAGNVQLAAQIAGKLPDWEAPDPAALQAAGKNPGSYLMQARLSQATRADRVVALFALQRLARQSTSQAYARWQKISTFFPEQEQRYFYGWLGYAAARAHDSQALQWYQAAGDEPLSPDQLAWRVRAALRAMNWPEVLAGINAMGVEQQREQAWQYWKARALEALDQSHEAQATFAALGRDYGFYGLLAADELDADTLTTLEAADHLPEPAEIDAVLAHPGIQRALLLYSLGLDNEATREWGWAVRKFNDRELLAAAEVALRNEIYDRAIDTAERTEQVHDISLRYPTPFRAELERHVRRNRLDEAWVYGLMRQESRFTVHANSNAGAAGVMQLMPSTARWAARRLGMKGYRTASLHDLDTNLKLGTFYLKTVLAQFHNNPVLAFAAYNAGSVRAQQWRGQSALEGAIYIETIPFTETRHYVRKVMSNVVYYSRLLGQPATSLKQQLGVIKPGNAVRHASREG